MFEEILYIYSHEIEFSMRVRNAGYKIPFAADSIIRHVHSNKNREFKGKYKIDTKKQYYFVRNNLIILYLHFSFVHIILRSIRYIIGSLMFGFTRSAFSGVVKGVVSFILLLPLLLKKRVVLHDAVQKEYGNGGAVASFFSMVNMDLNGRES